MSVITNHTKEFLLKISSKAENELLEFINNSFPFNIYKADKKLEKLPSSTVEIRKTLKNYALPFREGIIKLKIYKEAEYIMIQYKIFNRLYGIKIFFLVFSILSLGLSLAGNKPFIHSLFAFIIFLLLFIIASVWEKNYFKVVNQEFLEALDIYVKLF